MVLLWKPIQQSKGCAFLGLQQHQAYRGDKGRQERAGEQHLMVAFHLP
jgi:hypothetical protein